MLCGIGGGGDGENGREGDVFRYRLCQKKKEDCIGGRETAGKQKGACGPLVF